MIRTFSSLIFAFICILFSGCSADDWSMMNDAMSGASGRRGVYRYQKPTNSYYGSDTRVLSGEAYSR